MKKRLGWKKFKVFLTILCIVVLPFDQAFAAEDETSYKVTFRPGSQGWFDNTGDGDISANGSVTYTVSRGTPLASVVPDIVVNEGYYVKNTGELYSGVVESMTEYVVKYGMLVDTIAYEVRYLDMEGNEVARPYIGYTNLGESVSAPAKEIQDYEPDALWKSIAHVNEEDHTIEFVYKYTKVTETRVTPQTQAPVGRPGSSVAVSPDGTLPQQGEIVNQEEQNSDLAEEDPEIIVDNQVPLAEDADDETPDNEVAENEPVPLAQNQGGKSAFPIYLGAGILLVLILILSGRKYFKLKK